MRNQDTMEAVEFIEKEKGFLWSRAMGLTRKSEDAEDLFQDTMVKIYQGWASFEPGTNFRAWAGRIMLNTHLNNVARNHEKVTYDFATSATDNAYYHSSGEEEAISYAVSPEKIFFMNHIDGHVMESLYTLPDEFRKPFSLFHFEGYAYEEIAEMLKLPIGTIKSRIFRARKTLKELLGAKMSDLKKAS